MMRRPARLAAALLALSFFGTAAPQRPTLPPAYQKWLDQEVVYIIKPLERDVFLKLQSDRERDLFIEAFWRQRDPDPGSKENAFRKEHYRRLDHANKSFGRSAPLPGWKTDRGRIYIILGEPDDTQRFTGTQGVYPAEVWFYQDKNNLGLETGFHLLFFQERGSGDYKLYSPANDGPQALLAAYTGHPTDYEAAYQQLKTLAADLAEVSMSLIPGEGHPGLGKPTLASDMLIRRVENLPQTLVEDRYARKFLEFKDVVEVEYSANYIDSDFLVHVLRDPGGLYFVHYVLEPRRLAVAAVGSGYEVNLKINGTVSGADGRQVYQFERGVALSLTEAQKAQGERKPFNFHDMFPLIPGTYRISVLLKNGASKEFTSFEERLVIPASGPGVQMTAPILGYNVVTADASRRRLKPYQIGAKQVYCQPGRVFARAETLTVAFQLFGLNPAQQGAAVIKYAFSRFAAAGQPAIPPTETVRSLRDQADPTAVLESFPLSGFAPAHYGLRVTVSADGRDLVASSDEFDIAPRDDLPRPWIFSQLAPGSADPESELILGTQLLNSGRPAEARAYLERAAQQRPDSEEGALALARSYFALGEMAGIPALLQRFLERPKAPKFEVFALAGQAFGRLGEYARAIAVLERAVTVFGVNAALLNDIGEAHARLGQTREALAAWDRSLQLDPKQSEVRKKADALREKK